jgi:serine/threonine-protein kinase
MQRPATRSDRDGLPKTVVEDARWTQSVSNLASLPDRLEATAVRHPSTAWIVDDQSRLGTGEFGSRYRVRQVLGQGGMGEVCLTSDVRIGREVATKFLHPAHAMRDDLRERFVREACLQGQLEHPSIVPVHDLGVAPDGRLFFTMKRVRGMTLQEIVNKLREGDKEAAAKFSRRKLLTAFSNICLTIAFAHEQGVIHRDLKPANVMLGDFGETYVLDWGLAVITSEGALPSSSTEAALAGTPGYMSPEQIGDPSALSPRADVYALGAILFEILTYETLHRRDDRDAVIRSTLNGADARASVRATNRNIPPELDAICVRATELVPQKRFPNVRELHDAIERFLDGDRDLALRSELAKKHVSDAEVSIRRAFDAPPEEEEEHRSAAIGEIGRAIALDPGNARAMKNLVRLLIEPPKKMPEEARAAAARVEERTSRFAERTAGMAFMGTFLTFPAMLWMGVRDYPAYIAFYVVIALLIGSHLMIARMKTRRPALFYVRFFLACMTVAVGTRLFGPLVMAPAALVGTTLSFMLNPERKYRAFAMFTAPLALLGPMMLEWTNVLSPSYVFEAGMMCILPNMTALPPAPTMFVLTFVSAGLPLMGGHYVARMRARLRRTEERSHLYSWHLQQLVPREMRTRPKVSALALPGSEASRKRSAQ